MSGGITWSVFTKPWKMDLDQLGKWVSGLGFDGIELPVRPGYPVEPEQVAQLPAAAKVLANYGVKILSVAGPADERTIAACGEAGVPVLRVMARLNPDEPYTQGEQRFRREYDELVPILEKHGVILGVQNHLGRFVNNAAGLMRVLQAYDPRQIAVVWDAAHEALCGSDPELALDLVWSHLCMVNLKNAYWMRTNGPEALAAEWRFYWTSGRNGLANWARVAEILKARGFSGVVCLTAEYTDTAAVDRLIAEDLAYAKSLFS